MHEQGRNEERRTELLRERAYIDSLLERLDRGDGESDLPPWVPVHVDAHRLWHEMRALRNEIRYSRRGEGKCALAREGAGHLLEMLVAPGQRSAGLSEIREFTRGAQSLIVLDPYIYGGEGIAAEEYVESLAKSLRLQAGSLKRLHIIYSSNHGNTKKIRTVLKRRLVAGGVNATHRDSPVVHDRIWIYDNSKAVVVGNSYGGLGGERASFILPLPRADLESLVEYLQAAGLLVGDRVS